MAFDSHRVDSPVATWHGGACLHVYRFGTQFRQSSSSESHSVSLKFPSSALFRHLPAAIGRVLHAFGNPPDT